MDWAYGLTGTVNRTVRVRDLAGNDDVTGTSTALFAVPGTPPVATVELAVTTTTTTNNNMNNPPHLNTTSVTFFMAVPAYPAIALLGYNLALDVTDAFGRVQLSDVSTFYSLRSTASTTMSITVPTPTSGVYAVEVTPVEVVGANSVEPQPTPLLFVIDFDPPTSSFPDPLPQYTNQTDLTIAIAVADALSSDGMVVSARHSYTEPGASSPVTSDWTVFDGSALHVTDLWDGLHVFELMCVDGAGNTQSPPYDSVSTTIDTTAPTVNFTNIPPEYTSARFATVCVSVNDATATAADIRLLVDGTAVSTSMSSDNAVCTFVFFTGDGVHTLTATAVDAAGNAATPVTHSIVVDSTTPSHTAVMLPSPDCITSSGDGAMTVCTTPAAAVFNITCVQTPGEPPCVVQWQLLSTVVQPCGVSEQPQWVTAPPGIVSPGSTVARLMTSSTVGGFTILTRARSAAGVVDATIVLQWYVDTEAPAIPTMISTPPALSTSTSAMFEFVVQGATASPGNYCVLPLSGSPLLVYGRMPVDGR